MELKALIDPGCLARLIDEAHADVNKIRAAQGLPAWNFDEDGEERKARTDRKRQSGHDYLRGFAGDASKRRSHFQDAQAVPADFGQRVRAKRAAEHLTLLGCALRLGMSHATIRAIESGSRPRLRYRTLVKLFRWLGDDPIPFTP